MALTAGVDSDFAGFDLIGDMSRAIDDAIDDA